MNYFSTKRLGLILGPIIFVCVLLWPTPQGMSEEAKATLACTLWVAIWWITEALPISVTSLLPLVLFPLSGALDLESTAGAFGHKYIFLYLGGFMLAIAIERWNLHRRIALNIINMMGTNIQYLILGFMIATGFLSMWISNTAASVMMLPIGIAIVKQLKDNPATIENENLIFGRILMLGIAYSASIGGMATLVGTPPNLVLAGVIQELYNIEITFAQWFKFGLPLSILLLITAWKYLTLPTRKFEQKSFPGGKQEIIKQLKALGRMTWEEKLVLCVFVGTATLWIGRSLVLENLLPNLDDTIIAVVAGLMLFVLPSRQESGRKLLTWDEAKQLPWGILLLFGGGLAIAQAFKTTGLAEWIGSQLQTLDGVSILFLLFIIVAVVNFLTEITSNLATTAMILPVLAVLAFNLDVHPYVLMVGATIAASCAFMLPVATPPNAVVFGSGYLTIQDMVKAGIVLNIISIFLVTGLVYFVLPYLWNFLLEPFPPEWGAG